MEYILEDLPSREKSEVTSREFTSGNTFGICDSAYKIYKRTFSSPPYKPVKPEIPTYIKMEDYTNVHAFVMKLQQYHPDYTQVNMHKELQKNAQQLARQNAYIVCGNMHNNFILA
ncbi:hypothetical protein Bca4012_028351 [Brassica carinata]|uniref:Uncharacterized protein n=2 Tax=Brassica oleracea TaxID=3712 RepID=A0A0D3BNN4_BRAOL|nr:unnamed protein product [Brassica oleracea]